LADSATPVIANEHLYLCSEPGLVTVAKTGDTFGVVHQYDLDEPIFRNLSLFRQIAFVGTIVVAGHFPGRGGAIDPIG
jgi:hypothetical protein